MSHFSVLVITDKKPTEAALKELMLPYHEYECTGIERYLQDVDVTDEVLEQFNEEQKVVFLADGSAHSRWDDRFYTKAPKEKWGNKQFELPFGAREETLPADKARELGLGRTTMKEAAEHYFGNSVFERDGRWFKRTNPNSKWDWYQIGGRWTGVLVPNYNPNEDPANQETCFLCHGTGKRTDMDVEGGCNGCKGTGVATKWPTQWKSVGDIVQLKELPLEALRLIAEQKAAQTYDKAAAALAGHTYTSMDAVCQQYGYASWEALRDVKDNEARNAAMEKVRTQYWEQPAIKALRTADVLGFGDEPERFMVPREKFLDRARKGAICTFAVLKDGQWYQRGSMGWFGAVADEKDTDQWQDEFYKLLDGLPPETWLTIVDCHI